jgi:hypothetical protein
VLTEPRSIPVNRRGPGTDHEQVGPRRGLGEHGGRVPRSCGARDRHVLLDVDGGQGVLEQRPGLRVPVDLVGDPLGVLAREVPVTFVLARGTTVAGDLRPWPEAVCAARVGTHEEEGST